MPRPQRDYGVALRQDIQKIDDKIRQLAVERTRKMRMLREHEASPSDVDVSDVVKEVLGGGHKRGGRKRT